MVQPEKKPVTCRVQFQNCFDFTGCKGNEQFVGCNTEIKCMADTSDPLASKLLISTPICSNDQFLSVNHSLCLKYPKDWESKA